MRTPPLTVELLNDGVRDSHTEHTQAFSYDAQLAGMFSPAHTHTLVFNLCTAHHEVLILLQGFGVTVSFRQGTKLHFCSFCNSCTNKVKKD